ncbi:PstS family phosphate ABC transporter substrate-binding protein [Chromatocurvus halotolerans]|uniref:Phosphate-binding protein n=1 Tax=Chromatocurvus halotolerans TaxID=1132028 RepID=A0A4V2SBF9_9GAMM|nr:PstS family phosphate ABC transporter substrate-binding protein [Chromatocurvus halotolerans]TCO75090.1 phosphate ABC transporter substrate-binding protein (PhoT family) [Chromatocurvus halotolerans]
MTTYRSILTVSILSATLAVAAAAREVISIDGSSTVFPISEAFAEEFQIETRTRVTVGLSGTGGGFKKFCRGETDFTGASRPIRKGELEECRENGVEFIELPIAMDALANVVHPDNDWAQCMTVDELRRMWEPEAQGTITNWNQIRDTFPDAPLRLFGAGVDSGTYDYYTFALTGVEHYSRGDFTATEDDNVTVQGVSSDRNAFGFLGLAYLDENRSRLRAVTIRQEDGSCVGPSVETARDGSYQPLSRPLFMYVNASALDRPAVQAYADYMMDPENGVFLVEEVGYVPLPEEAFEMGRAKIKARKTGSYFDGGSEVGVMIEDLLAIE